jgi:hypothetical protein
MSFLVEASPPLESRYPIIDKNILSYKLVEHYFYPFLQKELIKNVVKGLTMSKVQSPENLLPIFIAKIS